MSADATTWTQVVAVSGNTLAETTHPRSGISARYVRLAVSAPTQGTGGATRIYELRAIG